MRTNQDFTAETQQRRASFVIPNVLVHGTIAIGAECPHYRKRLVIDCKRSGLRVMDEFSLVDLAAASANERIMKWAELLIVRIEELDDAARAIIEFVDRTVDPQITHIYLTTKGGCPHRIGSCFKRSTAQVMPVPTRWEWMFLLGQIRASLGEMGSR